MRPNLARKNSSNLASPFSPGGSASAAFAALKSTIGATLTALMKERAMEDDDGAEPLDVLEEVISEDDMDEEVAALAKAAGGALPKTRSLPRPPGKGAGQRERQAVARGVKRAAEGREA